jgi:hypothetical protein
VFLCKQVLAFHVVNSVAETSPFISVVSAQDVYKVLFSFCFIIYRNLVSFFLSVTFVIVLPYTSAERK